MKKKSVRRMLSMITGVAVLATIIPASVMADTGVRYVDGTGEYEYCTDYNVVDASDHEWKNNEWYVVKNGTDNKVIFWDRIEINGNVNLILDDTVTLYAMNGIHVSPGNSLTIYGRSIDLTDPDNSNHENLCVWMEERDTDISGYAAIGGNAGEKNGKITIASGRLSVHSTADGGAGIGTGKYGSREDYKADTSNSGINYGNITIQKAYVAASGGYNAAAIGGGDYADSEGIMIYGGTVRAMGNYNQQQNKPDDALIGAAGIGGGRGGYLFAFYMDSGNVIAGSCGIGSGLGNGYGIPPTNNLTISISGGTLATLSNWGNAAMIGGTEQELSYIRDNVVQVYKSARIKYTDVDGWPTGDVNIANASLQVTLDISEYKKHNVILIEPCPHEEHTYVPTASTHIVKCATCRADALSEEKHTFDSENRCSVCGYEAPVVFNVRAQLTGKITIVYLFRLSEDLKKDENAYVSFTSSGKTWTQKFADMLYDSSDNAFGSFVHVDAMNLADSIVINVYNGNGEKLPLVSKSCTDYTEEGFSYSIKDYSEHIFSNPWYEDFAKSLCNYGAMVCNYFKDSYGDWNPDLNALNAVTEETLAPYALKTNGKENRPAGISRTTIRVSFDSDNTLRITYYLTDDSEIKNLKFTLDGQTYTPKPLGTGVYAIDVEDIAAPDLDVPHTFVVSDSNKTYTIEASAMSYALTSMKSGDEKRANLGKAFYLYNQEANKVLS